MRILTRSEEFLLVAVWRLQQEAYTVPIRKYLKKATGKEWAFGALFVSLERLVKKGFLNSYLSETTPKRGGRSRRIYFLTPDGKQALLDVRRVERTVWHGLSEMALLKTK